MLAVPAGMPEIIGNVPGKIFLDIKIILTILKTL
jgi:hypothetical protein